MPSGTLGAMASAQPINQASHRGAPVFQGVQQAVSPPSRDQLKSWWKGFGRRKEKEEEKGACGEHSLSATKSAAGCAVLRTTP